MFSPTVAGSKKLLAIWDVSSASGIRLNDRDFDG